MKSLHFYFVSSISESIINDYVKFQIYWPMTAPMIHCETVSFPFQTIIYSPQISVNIEMI